MTKGLVRVPAMRVEELIDELGAHSPSAFVRFALESGIVFGSPIRTYRDRSDVVVLLDATPPQEPDESDAQFVERLDRMRAAGLMG